MFNDPNMDRATSFRPSERPYGQSPAYNHAFAPPIAQPPLQIPHSDPFQTSRDPFLPGTQNRRGSFGLAARAWPPAQGNGLTNDQHHPQSTPPQQPSQPLHPPPHNTNGIALMALPYDPSRRRSLGGGSSGSPPQPSQGPIEPPPPPPSFQSRQMPPPSPPHLPSSASSLPGSAPRGPPTASPFAGARDLASFASYRPAGGMSISSILGGSDERKPQGSPSAPPPAAAMPKAMPPPSPGRARSTSMREPGARGFREASPPRHPLGEPRMMGASPGHDRTVSDPRRDGMFGSPQFQHGFRPFQPSPLEQRPSINGHGAPGRPNSQPIEQGPPRSVEDIIRRDAPHEGRFATFRHFGEPQLPFPRNDMGARHETAPFQNGDGPTSHPVDREPYHSPHLERQRSHTGPMNFRPGTFGTPIREDQTGLFRPAYQPLMDGFRDPVEAGRFQDLRREMPRSSPPLSDLAAAERVRLGLMDRPITFEEHQRMEAMHRDQTGRKESDGSAHRALLNVSPELNRKGRNSPLPQAVQGAQHRHIGPGGNNPGVKMEFGRMFSGLGSGVGTATPPAGHSINGSTTPSRMSPMRHLEGGDLVRTAVAEIESSRNGSRAGMRGGKRNGRHIRDDEERMNGNGSETPDLERGSKRAKTNSAAHHHHHVHPHHHHHHHHEPIDNGPSPFNMLRFPSNPLSQPTTNAAQSHHHHHHHNSHAHPGHHHHHTARMPPPRKPTVTVTSQKLVEDCAKKPRNHLGSQLYTTEISMSSPADTPLDARVKYSSRMKPLPLFEGKENCTYTVRVPRSYLGTAGGPSQKTSREHFQEICKLRNLWGTDVYTDDSDVVAAAVHSGWMKGDFGAYNEDLHALCGNESEQDEAVEEVPSTLATPPRRPLKIPPGHDAHITVLILPPLELYASVNQHHIRSREWKGMHDGMSYMIHRIDFVDESAPNRNLERTAAARKQRLAVEEAKRNDAAAGLLMFAGGGNNSSGNGSLSVGA